MTDLRLASLALAVLAAPLAAQTTDADFELRPKNPALGAQFGTSVATTTTLAVVGAAGAPVQGAGSGAAFVYDVLTGKQVKRLLPADGGPLFYFGRSVAVADGVIAVGADNATGPFGEDGAVYFFDAATFAQTAKLVPPDAQSGGFGTSVALDGGRVLVGAGNRAFLFDVATGVLLQELTGDGGLGDRFGQSVALHGDRAVVGAPWVGPNWAHGAAYLFDTTTGLRLARLDQPTLGEDNDFGRSVALNGDLVLVGAPGSDRVGNSSGAAYLFDSNTGALLGTLDAASTRREDSYGCAVAISGDLAVVGAMWAGDRDWSLFGGPSGGKNTGTAYVFDLTTGAQVDQLLPRRVEEFDLFGAAVAVDATTVVAGSYWGHAAYVFL